MSTPIRLRRHVDGRFSVGLPGPLWLTSKEPNIADLTCRGDDQDCSGPGWSELFIAEMPEPDSELTTILGVKRAKFGPISADLNPDGSSSLGNEVCLWGTTDLARSTAASLVAAAAWIERQVQL